MTARDIEQVTRARKAAHQAVFRALKRGEIEKPDSCQLCGADSRLEAHHARYDEPLRVLWLCRSCHAKAHMIIRKGIERKRPDGNHTPDSGENDGSKTDGTNG